MYKNGTRSRTHSDYNLNRDFAKIRNAILETTQDVKGRTGEIFNQSLDDLKEKSQDYISEKPFKTLGYAFIGGFILGLLVRKR